MWDECTYQEGIAKYGDQKGIVEQMMPLRSLEAEAMEVLNSPLEQFDLYDLSKEADLSFILGSAFVWFLLLCAVFGVAGTQCYQNPPSFLEFFPRNSGSEPCPHAIPNTLTQNLSQGPFCS